jgi:hypothetical protein
LGNLQDITRESYLQRQLTEEVHKSQEEAKKSQEEISRLKSLIQNPEADEKTI